MALPNTTGEEKRFYKQAIRAALIELPNTAVTATNSSANADTATCNEGSGIITSSALTTAAAADYTLTLSNSMIKGTGDIVFATVQYGTASTGAPVVTMAVPTAGQVVITVQNIAASAALNGTIVVSFVLFRVQGAQL